MEPGIPKALTAIDGVTLDVAPGEFVVLLGPSGCGKSSLLYLVAGLEAATEVVLLCDGQPIAGPSAERGMIFQEASLYPWLTIAGNVSFGLMLQGVAASERRTSALKLLRKVGLSDAANKRPDELSGGMRQRASLARALAMRPKVLLVTHSFDEALALADRIVVFTARPGRVKESVPVQLLRPRSMRDPRIIALQQQLADLLAYEVDRAFLEQEAAI
jgi:NitT/TauT family transport system ATP-binding protein